VLIHLAAGSLFLLLVLSAIANIILGAGLPTVGCYILLATLVAPTLIQMGIEPMAAHMFILYYGCLSMITPPVCIAAFAAANLAGSDPMRTGYLSMALGWTVFLIPFLFVYSGTLLMQGSPFSILLDFATAVAAVWLISASFMGYSVRFLGLLDRGIYFVAGACLMLPVGAFANARWFNIAGGVMAATLFVWERSRRRLAEPAPATMAAAVTPSAPMPVNPTDRALLDRMGVRGTGEGE
jgi:TRAP-type uncharacterized transport system fused permease subunit